MELIWVKTLLTTNPRDSEYVSIPEPTLNPLMILMKVELASGSALPREKYDAGTILAISYQVTGVSPELIKVMSPYKVMLCYWEGNHLELIVGELMGVTL